MAPQPLFITTPVAGPSVRPMSPIFGTQESAPRQDGAPLLDTIPAPTFTMPPVSMSDPRYIESQRSPASYYSGNAHVRRSTEQMAPNNTSRRRGHKRNATEMIGLLESPLRVGSTSVKASTLPRSRPLFAMPTDYVPSSSMAQTPAKENLDPHRIAISITDTQSPASSSRVRRPIIGTLGQHVTGRDPLADITSGVECRSSTPVALTRGPPTLDRSGTLASRRGQTLSRLVLPERKTARIRDPRQKQEVDKDAQGSNQPSDSSTTLPLGQTLAGNRAADVVMTRRAESRLGLRPVDPFSLEPLVSYHQQVHDRMLLRTLKAKDEDRSISQSHSPAR